MLEAVRIWFISSESNAIAGWAGLVISIVGFWFTYRAANESKFAAESALKAITNIDVLQNLHQVVAILGNLKGMHQDKTELRVMSIHYSEVTKLLLEAAQSREILSKTHLGIIDSVVLHSTLAQTEYEKAIRDKEYQLDHGQLFNLLLEDETKLTSVHAAIRNRIGEDYVRTKSQISQ